MQVGQADIAILDKYLAIGWMTCEVQSTISTVDHAVVYGSQRGRPITSQTATHQSSSSRMRVIYASVNLVYTASMDDYA